MDISKLIKEYKTNLNDYNKKLKDYAYECIYNLDIDLVINKNNFLAIIVMDNPGREEKEQSRYLVGSAGKAFNKVLNSLGILREQVIVLNKSSITTPATGNLNDLYKNNLLKEIFIEEQKTTTNFILNLQKIFNIPILVHGYNNYLKNNKKYVDNEKGSRPLYIFFNKISKDNTLKDKIYFYKHSSYGNLSKQISKHCKKLKVKNLDFDMYLDLGKENIKGFF